MGRSWILAVLMSMAVTPAATKAARVQIGVESGWARDFFENANGIAFGVDLGVWFSLFPSDSELGVLLNADVTPLTVGGDADPVFWGLVDIRYKQPWGVGRSAVRGNWLPYWAAGVGVGIAGYWWGLAPLAEIGVESVCWSHLSVGLAVRERPVLGRVFVNAVSAVLTLQVGGR